jgi:hypothetical protein
VIGAAVDAETDILILAGHIDRLRELRRVK